MSHPMNPVPEGRPLSREVRVTDIEDDAAETIAITEPERTAIIGLLELEALPRLSFDYSLRRRDNGKVHLSGRLRADATQTCVVTLEPVEATVDVSVELEFWPAPLIAKLEGKAEDLSPSGLFDWPEPITDDTVDLGPAVYESLATALDPYPKKPGASFDSSHGASDLDASKSGPFAALKQLKEP